MPVEKRLTGPRAEEVRYKIKVVQIINRLQDYFFQDMHGEEKPKINLTTRQFAAAKILLNKALPDLSAIKMEATTESQIIVYGASYERDKLGIPGNAQRITEGVDAFNQEPGEDEHDGTD